MRTTALLITLFTAITSSFGQSVPWERINPGPIESSLYEIVRVPQTNRLIAIGSNATVLYSEDMGISWIINYMPAGISRTTRLNAIQFVNENLGFIAGDNATLLKTENGGLSWKPVTINGNDNLYDLFFLSGQTGFLTKHDSVMKTTDGGITWVSTNLNSDGQNNYLENIHFVNDSLGFLKNKFSTFYYKTTDAGNTWDSVTIYPAIEGLSLNTVYFLNENTGFTGGTVSDFSSNTYYILRTSDGGKTWQEVYTHHFNSIQHFYFYDSLTGFAVGRETTIYHNKILYTQDGGFTWYESNMPYNILNLAAPSFLDNGQGLCVGDYGQILKSEDWGQNWDIQYEWKIDASEINDARIVDDSLLFIGTTSASGCAASGNIFKSNDRGYTWEKILDFNPVTSFQFVDAYNGVAVCNCTGEITKTTDGGNTWEIHEINSMDFNPQCLCFLDEQTGFAGGYEHGIAIYKTTDGCETWEKSVFQSNKPFEGISDITFRNDSNGFATIKRGQYYFLRTINQGETWLLDSFNIQIEANKILFLNSDVGFVIGNKILKTCDGGQTWVEIPDNIEGGHNFTSIDFPSENVGYLTMSGNEKTMMRTDDGGDTWHPLDFEFYTTSEPQTTAFFSEEEGLAMGKMSMIFKTYTGGLVGINKKRIAPKTHPALVCYPNPVKNILTVQPDEAVKNLNTLEFYNTKGVLVRKVIVSGGKEKITVNLTGLIKGTYFVILTVSDGTKYSAKIVKL